MRTTVVTSLALGAALAWGSPLPALAQGFDQAETQVACFIPYGSIPGIAVKRGGVDETGETVPDALLQLVGTPSGSATEKLRLRCTDQVDPPGKPQKAKGFACDIFRGHRNPTDPTLAFFETTSNTQITVDGAGFVTMTCTTK